MKEKNHMSFKEWSAAQNARDKKYKPDDKPAVDQPKTQPANTPAEVVSPPPPKP